MGLLMKKIETQGINDIVPLDGSSDWYWGIDYTGGDLYEAGELFLQGHAINKTRLILIHYPDGKVIEPIGAKQGQYFGKPVCCEGKVVLLTVDFPAGKIKIMQFDHMLERPVLLAELPLSCVDDCYNLMLKETSLMLIRHGSDHKFQILWPQSTEFYTGNKEAFLFRDGGELYFSTWFEDPNYREEVIVRKMDTGDVLRTIPECMMAMPDGQIWIFHDNVDAFKEG